MTLGVLGVQSETWGRPAEAAEPRDKAVGLYLAPQPRTPRQPHAASCGERTTVVAVYD